MPKKRFSAEQIVTLLRQIEVAMGQGTRLACSMSSEKRTDGRPYKILFYIGFIFAACMLFWSTRATWRAVRPVPSWI